MRRKDLSAKVVLIAMLAFLGLSSSMFTFSWSSHAQTDSRPLSSSLELLGAGARWAALDGNNCLYVNWYNNLLAHPNSYSPDPNVWLPKRAAVTVILEEYGFNVSFAGDILASLTDFNVLVIDAYWACEPSSEQLIREYVSNGGGIVLLYATPRYFATYCKDWWPGFSLAPIKEWFGAGIYCNSGGLATVVVDNPIGTSLVSGDNLGFYEGYSRAAVIDLHNDSTALARWGNSEIFSFVHEFGQGRVYYQAEYEIEPRIAITSVSMTPEMPNYNDQVTITTVLAKNAQVDQVTLSYTQDSAAHNVSMDHVDNTYVATIPEQSYGTLVQYRVYANDTDGSWATSELQSYMVFDQVPPEIVSVAISPSNPTVNDTVEITAGINEPEEASGVKNVLFSFKDNFDQWWNTNMTYQEEYGLWTVIIPQQPHNATVQYRIAAFDNAGNVATMENAYTILPELQLTVAFVHLSIFSTVILVSKRTRLSKY